MTLSNYMPMDVETRLVSDRQNMLNNVQQGQSFDPNTLANLHSINKFWGWMDPGAQLSLAKAGFDGTSPAVAKAAQLSLTQKQRDNQFKQLMNTDPSDLSKIPKSVYNSLSPQQRDQIRNQAGSNIDNQNGGGILGTGVGPDISPGDLANPFGTATKLFTQNATTSPALNTAAGSNIPVVSDIGKTGKDVAREAGILTSLPEQEITAAGRSYVGAIHNVFTGKQDLTTAAASALGPQNLLQTTAGQQGVAAIGGKDPFATGSGLLPDPTSPIAKAQAAATRQFSPYLIGGHAWTPGRAIANTVFEPDSAPFDAVSGFTDAAIALKTDPTITLLQQNSEARAAQKFFSPEPEAANNVAEGQGVLFGPPESVNTNTAQAWVNATKNTRAINDLTASNSVGELWRMTGKKLNISTLQDLAATNTPEDTRQVLLNHVEPGGFSGPLNVQTPGGLGYRFSTGLDNSVWAGLVPGRQIQPANAENTVRNLDDLMQGGHVSVDTRNSIIDKFASRINSADPNADFQARQSALQMTHDTLKALMTQQGTPEHITDDILGKFFTGIDSSLEHVDTQVANPDSLSGQLQLTLGDQAHPLPSYEDLGEWANTAIDLPNNRDVRSATSSLTNLYQNPAYSKGIAAGDAFMNSIWKPLHLLRPALALRIIADSQANIAARGYEGLFNHPINWISLQMGQNPDSNLSQFFSHVPGLEPRYIVNGLGAPIVDPRDVDLLNNLHNGLANVHPGTVALRNTQSVAMDHPLAARGVVEEMQQLASDPVVSHIMNQPTLEDAKQSFYDSQLRQDLKGTQSYIVNSSLAKSDLGGAINLNLEDRPGSDAFVDAVMNRVMEKTGQQGDLLEAVRTGDIRGTSLWRGNRVSNAAINRAQDIINEEMANPSRDALGMAGPTGLFPGYEGGPVPYDPRHATTTGIGSPPITPVETTGHGISAQLGAEAGHDVTGPGQISTIGQEPQMVPALPDKVNTLIPKSKLLANREQGVYNSAVQTLFNAMLEDPDVKVDRIPAFVQSYWGTSRNPGTIEQQIPYLSADDRSALLANAQQANLPSDVMARLQQVEHEAGGTQVALEHAHYNAQADALDNIVNMVHDLHSRSQLGDMTRLLFPFGDAFRRIATRWATTIWDNPESLRKFYMGMNAAKSSGFFHTDPITKGMVFTIPFSDWLTDKTIGVPIPLQSQVNSLSMVGEGIPGFGPAVTVPAQYLLPDTPKTDTIRDLLWPGGRPANDTGIIGQVGDQILPSFVKTLAKGWQPLDSLVNGPPDPRTYATTVGSMMKYLASTGAYDLHGPNAQQETARMMQDAKDKAQYFYIIRGLAGGTLPAPSSPNYQIKDPTGHLQSLAVVTDDYYKQEQKLGPDGALNWLIQHYGENNVFIAQSFSQSLGYAVPITTKAYNWVRENPSIQSKYPLTYGLYAPADTTNNLDITALNKQFETGEREPIAPQDQVNLANTRVGLWIYHQARDQILQANGGKSLNSAQTDILNNYKQQLMQEYPGFGLIPFDTSKLVNGLAELQNAAKDPTIKNTDAGQGLTAYFAARQQAIDAAPQLGAGIVSPFRAKAAVGLRNFLRQQADAIIAQHPGFAPMWNEIFSHEMAKDT